MATKVPENGRLSTTTIHRQSSTEPKTVRDAAEKKLGGKS